MGQRKGQTTGYDQYPSDRSNESISTKGNQRQGRYQGKENCPTEVFVIAQDRATNGQKNPASEQKTLRGMAHQKIDPGHGGEQKQQWFQGTMYGASRGKTPSETIQ
jgi:hypothetical protein